ncbi:3-hydroxyacyl-CoA dehydrogenase [Pseudorhodoferax sp. Leaf274]|uniref:3-hydroxyacyl-CoA dehydrogenase n=1 Tax=Pseudorhodoferax sp. Leaf274 TaxID=1736318 RepID=UPI0007028F27|nr:3-hydroxyacyl-CoA dehydrogenase [Pseudorhodoferax sp. Leaf274]KQP37082.1 hypothetical protein ASF44_15305 [Pseudorhodoferax sp. Leaf274]
MSAAAPLAAAEYLAAARREAWRVPDLGEAVARPVGTVGVLGAGTMGRGIAMCFLNAGIATVLVDTNEAGLRAAVQTVRGLYDASADKGRITAQQVDARMALLRVQTDDAALAQCDLVVEAVFEDLVLKQQVAARLGALCKPGCVIATNTSTLDVDLVAEASGRPADVVGLHFFSPANVMKLLEVVRGRHTAQDVLATALAVARTIDKQAVVSGVCYGFIGNRMAEVYLRETEFLLLEGATPRQLDAVMESIGMAMGPCRMLDMAGVDVGAKTVIERGKAGGLPDDPGYRCLVRELHAQGRHGQKTAAGFYRYEGRLAVDDSRTLEIAAALAQRHGIARRDGIDSQEVLERLLYPMVNEAARLLEEGIALRGSDVDVVWTSGYGFPEALGGPLFMADAIGLADIVRQLDHYARQHGDGHGYWTVSPLLRQLAAEGRRISQWRTCA